MTQLWWILVAVFGAGTQVVLLTMQYMEYQISTSVTFAFEDHISLPSLTICSELVQLIDWEQEKVMEECARFLDPSCINKTSNELLRMALTTSPVDSGIRFVSSFPARDVFVLTQNIDAMFLGQMREDQGTGKIVAQGLETTFHISEFVMTHVKCFTLNWKPEFARANFHALKRQSRCPGMFAMLLRPSAESSVITMQSVTYSRNDIQPGIDDMDILFIPAKAGITSSTYNIFKTRLLGPPFKTDCFDYKVMGYANRVHCFESCIKNRTIQELGANPLIARITRDDDMSTCMSAKATAQTKDALAEMTMECEQRCRRQDCYQVVYSTHLKSSDTIFNTDISGHVSFITNSPTATTESMAKMSFTEYVTDVGSAVGVWLGLSVLSLLGWLETVARRLKRLVRKGVRPFITKPKTKESAE